MLFGKRKMHYLGGTFNFDNPATPLNMMLYPYEVTHRILRHTKHPIKDVLDVGGNIGQFSVTLAYFCKLRKLDIFEPNPDIVEMLRSNTGHLGKRVSIYNLALDVDSKSHQFHYEPGRSATGSFISSNASKNKNLRSLSIKTTSNPARHTGSRSYDLIKIDVEGHEIQALAALKGIKTKYLFIEISSAYRKRNYEDSEIFNAISSLLGEYRLLYMTGYNSESEIYEMLLEFI